jgi:hypothetical protein
MGYGLDFSLSFWAVFACGTVVQLLAELQQVVVFLQLLRVFCLGSEKF